GAVEGDRRQQQEGGAHRGADPYRRNARDGGTDDAARSRSRGGQARGQSVRLQAQRVGILGFSARLASNSGPLPLHGMDEPRQEIRRLGFSPLAPLWLVARDAEGAPVRSAWLHQPRQLPGAQIAEQPRTLVFLRSPRRRI